MKKNLLKIIIVVLIAVVLIPAGTASAADEQPTTVELYDIEIFNSLILEDDFLAIVPYQISFDTDPDVPIDTTYIFRLLNPAGTEELGVNTAVTTYNDGYGRGIVSFYVESGMTANTSYIFRIQQNPGYYDSPQYWDTVVSFSNYNEEADQSAALKDKIVDTAVDLTPEFGVSLLTTTESGSTVLSTYGELYYIAAVPGLQVMCPTLFGVQLTNPDFTKRTWSTSLATTLQTKYAGTFIDDFMTGYAGLFSIEKYPAAGGISVALFVILVVLSIIKFRASILAAILDGYCLLLLLMLMGFFSMIWAGFAAFFAAVIGGAILLFKRS